jgi:carnitine 3-dehydrogenase
MDVPELTDDLVNAIADQSDAQSGALSIRALERVRDNNLVAMMRALKQQDSAAGQLINAHEKSMRQLAKTKPKNANHSTERACRLDRL